MNAEEKHLYCFKSFRLDVRERQLLHKGHPIPLTPKAFEVLALLVKNHGHLVEKEDLLQTVWANSFVEEANITRIIHTLRKVLGEEENSNKFIETVAKKGYRFVAKVTEVSEVANSKREADWSASVSACNERSEQILDEIQVENEQMPFAPQKNRDALQARTLALQSNKTRVILFAVGFLSAVFLIFFLIFKFQNSSTNPHKAKSIAVLPLKPINAANRDELYENGIADSLIHRLSAMKGFTIRPLSATRKYADVAQDPLAAGKEQQVDYVLESNYQLVEGKIKITAQLVNVANGQIEETYKIEKDAGDIFAIQDAVAEDFGNKLLTRFATTSSGSPAKRGTNNEEAYRLYLQGMYLYDIRERLDAEKAVEALEKAVRLDPNYALAWAGKAHTHRSVANFGRAVDNHEHYRKSMEAVNQALALDQNLSDAYSALCENKMYYEWDFEGAEKACKRALELNSDSPYAHQIYARFLISRGRFDQAIAESKLAIDLEPASLFNQRAFADSLHFARRHAEAAAQYKRVIEMNENFGTGYMWLSLTLALSGKEQEAFAVWMKTLRKADEETIRAFQTAFQTEGWIGVMRLRAERWEKGNEVYFHGAAYNALIGEKDKAFEFLAKSFERREHWIAYLEVDPRLDNLRGDPRFEELVRRVGMK
jgi:DNA-binding winged helix-turn-helix (wHTH) protein/TolB-like protein